MYCPVDIKQLPRIQTAKPFPNAEDFSPCSCKIHSKLTSGNYSAIKKGEELSLSPSLPLRYTSSFATRDTNSLGSTKHTRNSTISAGVFKFVSATELVSFEEFQTPEEENPTDEVLNEAISDLSLEEPKHSIVYPSLHSKRNSLIWSTTDHYISSTAGSPPDNRISMMYTLSSTNSGKKNQEYFEECCERKRIERQSFYFIKGKNDDESCSGKIYCQNCKENVCTSVKFRNHKENLWERLCCGVLCESSVNFMERVFLCKVCRSELAAIKVKKENV
ncbi:hypothetical protein SteCoe_31651 [Stentor coeruleus]|uniref:Uncharacterized protein n=1 Tax=Stentor coeruleus TaxID=5963 RepID=A0A1R2B198_9CILI|nr:hypothetical protein SteCoe_31651 [Stentor coeruleus]